MGLRNFVEGWRGANRQLRSARQAAFKTLLLQHIQFTLMTLRFKHPNIAKGEVDDHNQAFWLSYHRLGEFWKTEREGARQDIIAIAKVNEPFRNGALAAGVWQYNYHVPSAEAEE